MRLCDVLNGHVVFCDKQTLRMILSSGRNRDRIVDPGFIEVSVWWGADQTELTQTGACSLWFFLILNNPFIMASFSVSSSSSLLTLPSNMGTSPHCVTWAARLSTMSLLVSCTRINARWNISDRSDTFNGNITYSFCFRWTYCGAHE